MEGACIVRKDLEGLVLNAAEGCGLKVKHAQILPDVIITLGGRSFAFVLESCLRSLDATSLYDRSVLGLQSLG